MSRNGEALVKSLQNVIDFQNGDTKKCIVRKRKIEVQPLKEYTHEEIKALRNEQQVSQVIFAEIMGVTPQAVEAWEAGKRKPTGTAKRLIQLIEQNPNIIDNMLVKN